ncbi:hypothetical protein KFL_002130070 [Klebsormidium nitens]|uniref:Uncharacterized protein n=1 Tax=Klebsormidium nitens TaxID=105231 RepID=A0A1Y1I1Y1_KLENI|nr:hypothetical protein KFL_002130070 [Klebsormidium nitens]|eukprot:GAQ84930.1 hypothetical protein KFL_002130070 [Klebsormidium nitens]
MYEEHGQVSQLKEFLSLTYIYPGSHANWIEREKKERAEERQGSIESGIYRQLAQEVWRLEHEPLLRPNENSCGHSKLALFIFLYLNPLSLNHRAAEFVALLAILLPTSGAAALALARFYPQGHYAASFGLGGVALVILLAMQRLYLTVAERVPRRRFLGHPRRSCSFTGPLSYFANTQKSKLLKEIPVRYRMPCEFRSFR